MLSQVPHFIEVPRVVWLTKSPKCPDLYTGQPEMCPDYSTAKESVLIIGELEKSVLIIYRTARNVS